LHPILVGGVAHEMTLTLTFTGTYSNINSTTKFVTVTADLTMVVRRSSPSYPCDALTGAGSCILSVTTIFLSGTLSHTGSMPTLVSGDIATLGGGSGPGSFLVMGGATACGIMPILNNGYVVFQALTLSVV
jgi:hypothetical protein